MKSAAGPQPERASLFITCLVDQFFPEVGEAVVEVVERLGAELSCPRGQTCCGLPHYNNGFWKEAREIAERNLRLFPGEEAIVVPSGSCGWMLRSVYPTLFPRSPWEREQAQAFARRVYEFSEYLVHGLGATDCGSHFPHTLTYHDSCHLLRGLGRWRAPRALLQAVSGARLVELEGADQCCGFGGIFAVKHGAVSESILEDKLRKAEASGAEILVAADCGCMLQMAGGLSRRGSRMRVLHLAQVLAGSGGER
ncbi:MAG: (Fe-S)-binding protein [Nitrospinota bacterium]